MAKMRSIKVSDSWVLITDGTKSGSARVVSGNAKYTIDESQPLANAPASPFDDEMAINPGPLVYAKAAGKGEATINIVLY